MGDDEELGEPTISLDDKPLPVNTDTYVYGIDAKDISWGDKPVMSGHRVIGENGEWGNSKPSDGLNANGGYSLSFTISNVDYKRLTKPHVKDGTRYLARVLNDAVKHLCVGGRLPRKKKKLMKKINAKIIAKYYDWDYYQILKWLKVK